MNLLQIFNLFSGVLLVFIAIVLIRKKRFDRYVRPLLFLILVNLSGIFAVGFETTANPVFWKAGYVLLFFYLSFLPAAWYLLTCRWGLDDAEYARRSVFSRRIILAVSTAIFIFLMLSREADLTIDGGRWYLDLSDRYFLFSIFLVICVTLGLYSLETCYRSSLGLSRERIKRSFFPLLAYGIALLAVATVTWLYHQISDWMLTITFLLSALVFVPVARHYILFHPASDGIILTRKGVYSSIVVVLVGIYFLIIGSVGEFLVKYNLDDGLFFSVVILALLVMTFMILVLSQTIKSRFKALSPASTKLPGKGVYAAEWKEFTEEISVILGLEAIYRRSDLLLRRLIKVDHSFFVIKESDSSSNFTLYCVDGVGRGIPGEQLDKLCDWLYRFGHPVEVATLKEKVTAETGDLANLEKLIPFDLFLLVPFVARQSNLGFWGIGARSGGRPLNSDEIGFIEAAANPVSLTVLGAQMTGELVTSRELESFHRVSSFVLHDLKNSVGMLSMLLQNAKTNMGNPEFQKEALLTIGKAVERQKKIIARLTDQKADDKLSLKKCALADLVRKTLERVRLDSVKSVELQFELEDGYAVFVDAEKMASVFDNLVINALEAMPDGGTLRIFPAREQPPGMVAVVFADSGNGMDSEFISTRLFKPFSSTKAHGLGIGMYQSREIIKAHQGRIEVTSAVGEGSEITIILPGEK